MEYIESLLEEYFQLSNELDAAGGSSADRTTYEDLLAIEEEICFEAALPISEMNRNLFRFISKNQSMKEYVDTSIQNLKIARSKYQFKNNKGMLDVFKAA